MSTYSVKQIADILQTNPETVRRWIRDKKLKAVQVSRKTGNVVTETELERFLKATPKYLPKYSASLAGLTPLLGIGAVVGSTIAGALIGYYSEKEKTEERVQKEDFKKYLLENVSKLDKTVLQKRSLIQQTEDEINELQEKINQYKYLLEHDQLLEDTLKITREEKGA